METGKEYCGVVGAAVADGMAGWMGVKPDDAAGRATAVAPRQPVAKLGCSSRFTWTGAAPG